MIRWYLQDSGLPVPDDTVIKNGLTYTLSASADLYNLPILAAYTSEHTSERSV